VAELRRVDPAGASRAGRAPLRELDAVTREAIASAREVIDGDAATAAWERALRAPAWSGPPVWIHSDLLRPNLLVRGGRLRAVIDFGAAGAGDPPPTWSPPGACSARPGGRCSGAASGSTTAPGSGPAATPSTRRP
jgi:hypothetical protein